MRRTLATFRYAVLAAGLITALAPSARAQLATLDKGHQILVNNGLQIWGSATDIVNYDVNYAALEGANMNGVMWGFPANGYTVANGGTEMNLLSAGDKWAKWTPWEYNGTTVTPQTALTAAENARKADLIALQVGDEINQSDMETGTQTRDWLWAAGNGTATSADDVFPNALLYVNSFHIINHNNYANFLAAANPDAISWDSYPFANPHGHYITPTNWLSLGQQFRRHGLGSYIGATNAPPRPYGMYVQTYNDSFAVDPGEVQIRWQQFAAWTMGYKFVDAFIFSGGNNNFGNNTSGPVYLNFKETARQGRNLGPALTRLISYGYGTSIVQGKNASGQTNPVPGDWLVFNQANAPPAQQYLTSVSARSLSYKNGVDTSNPDGNGGFYGYAGDVYVGFFNPLHTSFGPAGSTYFMIMNGLGGNLTLPNGQSDNTALVSETVQQITLGFNFGASGINSLQRLRRSDGQVEIIPLTHITGNQYQYIFNLEGGTGDLFKYNDGSPFVGIEAPINVLYWDNDGVAAGNNTSTGAGMGGSGNWDNASSKWFNGSSNGAWVPNNPAVFWGTAGTVTLGSPQFASSLSFKTDGYTISDSTLTLSGSSITVDAGLTASIGSTVAGTAGLVKNGPGTLNLTSANTYSGGTTINSGVLGIVSVSLGQNPASPTVNVTINNGATLRFNQNNLTLTAQRMFVLGAGGGVIDTNLTNTIAGDISGSTLTKTGAGTLTISGTNSHSGNTINGGTLVVASDSNLGSGGGSLAFGGGTLRPLSSFSMARPVSVNSGGGSIDNASGITTSLTATIGGGAGNTLTKTGSGTLVLAQSTPRSGLASSWLGNITVSGGTVKVGNGGSSGFLPGYDPIAYAGLPPTVPSIALASGTVLEFNHATGGPSQDTTHAVVISGAGNVVIAGAKRETFVGNNTYTGTTTINSGSSLRVGWGGASNVGGLGNTAVTNNGALTFSNDHNTTFIGSVSGTGTLLKEFNGTLVMLGNVTHTGGTTISGGTLQVGNGGTAGTISGNVVNNANLTIYRATNLTFSGAISGTGSFTKRGAGTLTFDSAHSYGGGTNVNGGKLLVNNTSGSGTGTGSVTVNSTGTLGGTGTISGAVTINNNGHIAPGASIESLGVGSLTLGVGSILDFELDTVSGDDVSDLVIVGNTNGLTINGGTLNLTDAGSMTGGTYTLINYAGTLGGSLSNITLGTTPAGFTYSLVNNMANTTIDLVVTPPGIPGDFNEDGTVNAADYVWWQKFDNSPQSYTDWSTHFGDSSGSGAGASGDLESTVPEPSPALMLLVGLGLLTARRRILG
jgi:autotransporter-associated beta strand protein